MSKFLSRPGLKRGRVQNPEFNHYQHKIHLFNKLNTAAFQYTNLRAPIINKNFIMGSKAVFANFSDMCVHTNIHLSQTLVENDFETIIMPEYNVFDFHKNTQGKQEFFSESDPDMS